MRVVKPLVLVGAMAVSVGAALPAQPAGKFPPDSLVNTKVISHATPVLQVVGTMRNFTSALGVRCQFCHLGQEGQPLPQFDFVSDDKRTKQVAREMMKLVEEVNHRLDALPGRAANGLQVTCNTCHRGANKPTPLFQVMVDAAAAAGADSAIKAYRALRQLYYGRDTYDFSEASLNIAAFRTGQAGKPDEALKLLALNEEMFPASSGLSVFRGNILLMKADTTAAATAFREAIRRDSTNAEARGRLRTIGRQP